jgi:hypothetical protein
MEFLSALSRAADRLGLCLTLPRQEGICQNIMVFLSMPGELSFVLEDLQQSQMSISRALIVPINLAGCASKRRTLPETLIRPPLLIAIPELMWPTL